MGTWALVLTGIFSGAVPIPVMQLDADTIRGMVELTGDVTISQIGYSTEESCRTQLVAWEHRHTFTMNGMTITVKSVECRDTTAKANEGKGPKS